MKFSVHQLPFRRTLNWRWRWLQVTRSRSDVMHRILKLRGPHEARVNNPHNIDGIAVCGKNESWSMPGIFSRIGAPLCRDCRRILGVKTTKGQPYNAGEHERGCERPKEDRNKLTPLGRRLLKKWKRADAKQVAQ